MNSLPVLSIPFAKFSNSQVTQKRWMDFLKINKERIDDILLSVVSGRFGHAFFAQSFFLSRLFPSQRKQQNFVYPSRIPCKTQNFTYIPQTLFIIIIIILQQKLHALISFLRVSCLGQRNRREHAVYF